MLLAIGIGLTVAVAGILGLAARRPDRVRVERTVHIRSSRETVFALVDDFRHWPSWAPQDRGDPRMTRSYGGSPAGVGAKSEWNSDGRAGAGTMTIVQSTPPARIVVEVDFARPFRAHNVNEFSFESSDGGTDVTWAMDGDNVLLMKVMSLWTDMDRLMGKHFEDGLLNLKSVAESNVGGTSGLK